MINRDSDVDCYPYGVPDGAGEQTIGFFLIDTFAMLPFVSALEPLRAANRFSGRALYSWVLIGMDGTAVTANNAMKIAVDISIADSVRLDKLIVCGPHDPHRYHNAKLIRYLRQSASRGTAMGSLDSGSYLLAQADLIKHRRCAIHWENLPGFREAFPQLSISSELFELHKGLFTCAGGTAALDMMLAVIRQDHGSDLATRVADLFIASDSRRPSDPQRRSIVERSGVHHPGVVSCIELMENNLDQPMTTGELATMVGLSARQLERVFRHHLQTTPTHYYQTLRLRAGRELLRQTTLSVLEVAAAVGFSSTDYFSRRFKLLYGYSPSEARKRSI